MAYNSNYGFKYPKGDDFYNVEDFNGNFDKTADELDNLKNNKSDKNHTHNAKELTSDADLNDIDDEGYYWCSSSNAATVKNKPDDIRFFGLRVTKISGGVFSQELVAEENKKFIRIYWSGGWSEWTKFVTEKGSGKYYYVAASSDSDEELKNKADFIYSNKALNLENFIDRIPEGGEIYFAPGTYEIDRTINIDKAITVTGSPNAVFVDNSGTGVFSIAAYNGVTSVLIKNVTIKNITLKRGTGDGSLINIQNADAINLKGLTFICENDVSINNSKYYSVIECSSSCTDIFVLNCIFWNNMIDLGLNKDRLYAVDMRGSTDEDSNTLIFCGNTMSAYCNVNFRSSAGYNGCGASGNLSFHLYVDYKETSQLTALNTLNL